MKVVIDTNIIISAFLLNREGEEVIKEYASPYNTLFLEIIWKLSCDNAI
jgi:predicted nucleic acid-binding protein